MLKLWKVNAKAGDATVKYPFAPFPTNKDMRGKPEHKMGLRGSVRVRVGESVKEVVADNASAYFFENAVA